MVKLCHAVHANVHAKIYVNFTLLTPCPWSFFFLTAALQRVNK